MPAGIQSQSLYIKATYRPYHRLLSLIQKCRSLWRWSSKSQTSLDSVVCCVCCLPHQLDWRDCSELSLFVWPDPGLVNSSLEIRTATFYRGIWKTHLPLFSSFWVPYRGHCFGIRQQRSVQGAKWKGSLCFQEQRNMEANLEREDLSRMWNWNQKADQGLSQLQELAVLFVSLMICPIYLSWFLSLSSKICLLYFFLFINRPIPQSKCQKEQSKWLCSLTSPLWVEFFAKGIATSHWAANEQAASGQGPTSVHSVATDAQTPASHNLPDPGGLWPGWFIPESRVR